MREEGDAENDRDPHHCFAHASPRALRLTTYRVTIPHWMKIVNKPGTATVASTGTSCVSEALTET